MFQRSHKQPKGLPRFCIEFEWFDCDLRSYHGTLRSVLHHHFSWLISSSAELLLGSCPILRRMGNPIMSNHRRSIIKDIMTTASVSPMSHAQVCHQLEHVAAFFIKSADTWIQGMAHHSSHKPYHEARVPWKIQLHTSRESNPMTLIPEALDGKWPRLVRYVEPAPRSGRQPTTYSRTCHLPLH